MDKSNLNGFWLTEGMGEEMRAGLFGELAWQLDKASFDSDSYALRQESSKANDGRSSRLSKLSHYERERIETLKLYLHLIGIGSDHDEMKAKVQERIVELLVERKETVRITELESQILTARERAAAGLDVFEPSFGNDEYRFRLYNDEKKKIVVEYYISPETKEQKREEGFYVYTPSGLRVERASQTELGSGVLGVAYIGLGLIKILDTLYGQDYHEVLKHEVLHHRYPHESESAIRKMTMNELPFPTSYQ